MGEVGYCGGKVVVWLGVVLIVGRNGGRYCINFWCSVRYFGVVVYEVERVGGFGFILVWVLVEVWRMVVGRFGSIIKVNVFFYCFIGIYLVLFVFCWRLVWLVGGSSVLYLCLLDWGYVCRSLCLLVLFVFIIVWFFIIFVGVFLVFIGVDGIRSGDVVFWVCIIGV